MDAYQTEQLIGTSVILHCIGAPICVLAVILRLSVAGMASLKALHIINWIIGVSGALCAPLIIILLIILIGTVAQDLKKRVVK